MKEKDFVMGYVCGYNDGADSGGGSGVLDFNNIPLLKKYRMVGTDYYIGISNPNVNCSITDKINSWEYDSLMLDDCHLAPQPFIYHWLAVVFFRGDTAIGYGCVESFNDYYSYSYPSYSESGTWELSRHNWSTIDKIEAKMNNNEYNKLSVLINYTYTNHMYDFFTDKETTLQYDIKTWVLDKDYSYDSEGKIHSYSMSTNWYNNESRWIDNPNDYGDVLKAWYNCTNIEEVPIS